RPLARSLLHTLRRATLSFPLETDELGVDLGEKFRFHEIRRADRLLDSLHLKRPITHLAHAERYLVGERETVDIALCHHTDSVGVDPKLLLKRRQRLRAVLSEELVGLEDSAQ